jgi:hypothetical protein
LPYLKQRAFASFVFVSYECKHLRNTFCDKRKKECDPGAPGCVLFGKFAFPLKTDSPQKKKAPPKATP